jgi:hypothetical protein
VSKGKTGKCRIFDYYGIGLLSCSLIQGDEGRRKEVVASLINSIVTEEDPMSYRINIYIAATLSLLKEGWIGTKQQRKAIEDLQ